MMGLFGASSIYDADVEKATSEKNTTDKWDLILEICDKVGHSSANAKECLRSIMRRLNHNDPHVVMRAITLLDACVNNCGKSFHLEIASRDFETEFKRLLTKQQSPEISQKLRLSLKKWAEGDFKSDPQLNLIPSLYQKLKSEGYDFSDASQPQKKPVELSKDPNVVSSQQEEDDIAKAIELSLKEAKTNSPKTTFKSTSSNSTSNTTTASSSLYPSMSLNSGSSSTTTTTLPEPRKVRALYDFEAAEDNELTFFSGEILLVLDDSDPNWWKGQNHRGEGLFPSNFVSADLSAEPEPVFKNEKSNSSKKVVQFSDEQSDNSFNERKTLENEPVQINEETIDRLLHLLHEADPEDPSQDTDDMLRLEHQVNLMHPLIDQELERVDRKHAQLTQLSSDLAEAVSLYHQLMRDDRGYSGGYIPSTLPPVGMQPPPPHMMYQENGMGMYNPNPYQMGQQFPHNYGPPSAFHSPIPQQMHNGHPVTTNGMNNYGAMPPQSIPQPQSQGPNEQNQQQQQQPQQNPNNFMPPSGPVQPTSVQFNQNSSPNHQMPQNVHQMYAQQQQHFNLQQHPNQSPSHHPQLAPNGQHQPQMMPQGQTNVQMQPNPGMMYQHQNSPGVGMQNIPVYQEQR
uniref:CSON006278 protein n=1 Tax=Culicoides sonorensis TaxID=179676 RepID=A0A336LWJ7_CULSO